MGVTITAYSRLDLTDPHPRGDICHEEHLRAFTYAGFEQSLRGAADHDHKFADGRGIGGRCYTRTDTTRAYHISDWSYTAYGQWRATLCRTVLRVEPEVVWDDPHRYADAPFFELINFADNEGCIGPAAARDLLADFQQHADQLVHLPGGIGTWTSGLQLAADRGLIQYR